MKKQLIALAFIAFSASANAQMFAKMFGAHGTPIPAVAWYKLDGNALDSSGNGYNGAVIGAVVTNGYFGQGYYFPLAAGANILIDNRYMAVSNSTLTCWFKYSSLRAGNNAMILGGNNNAVYVAYMSGAIVWQSVAGDMLSSSSSPIAAEEWCHLAITRISGVTRIYKDGVELASGARTTLGYPISRIGKYSGGDDWFNGTIDDVRFLDRGLSTANIQRIMTGQNVEPIEELQ